MTEPAGEAGWRGKEAGAEAGPPAVPCPLSLEGPAGDEARLTSPKDKDSHRVLGGAALPLTAQGGQRPSGALTSAWSLARADQSWSSPGT